MNIEVYVESYNQPKLSKNQWGSLTTNQDFLKLAKYHQTPTI